MNEREDSKRVAKNTLILYVRMLLMMLIGLYTSRLMLKALGIDNYGIRNVVGGFLSMFGIISASLTNAVSRFITVELGHNDLIRRQKVFATTVSTMLILGIFLVIIIETFGLWFFTHKLNIPSDRFVAAQWVFHCSVLGVFMGTVSLPYNSAIVAHERMSAFAYFSIIDVTFKLLLCYILFVTPFDRLITSAVLVTSVSFIMQGLYVLYCRKHFEECRYDWSFNKPLFKEISGFAGWNFLGEGAWILNTQGINMLMNIFFGVHINAARAVAEQVNEKITQFVFGFMTSLNPQIIKSYAEGNKEYAFKLACRGARFSFFIMFIPALPIMIESKQILKLWLVNPPEFADSFVTWTILTTFTTIIGNTLVKLQFAHGDIKLYQIVITICGCIPFPLTWLFFKIGSPPITAYWVFGAVYWFLIYVRFWLVHRMTGLPAKLYLVGVVLRCHIIGIAASIVPLLIFFIMEASIFRLFLITFISVCSSVSLIYFYGMMKGERELVNERIITIYKRIKYEKTA